MVKASLSSVTNPAQSAPKEVVTSPSISFKLQTLTFVAIIVLITARLDGFAQDNTLWQFQVSLIPYTLLFLFLIFLLFRPDILQKILLRFVPRLVENLENRWAWLSITLVVAFVFELATLGLVVFEGRYFASFGYSLNYPLLVGVYAVILGGLGWLWFNRHRRGSGSESGLNPVYILYWLLVAYLLVGLVSILWFPLNPKRSDMLPLITEAGHTFLNGQSPYRVYPLVSGAIELTYLPGTWLSYLPAIALGLDVRLMSLLYVVGTALILYCGCRASERSKVLLLISAFILNPYLQYRHEIYLAPYWCVMAVSLVAFRKNRPLWGVFFFGLSITMSQFSWIMLPFFLLPYTFRNPPRGRG